MIKYILLGSLFLRLILAPLVEHGDVINYYWWAKDIWERGFLGFYDRNIDNAMRPTYPPVTSYIFWISALLHNLVWKISWFLNSHLPIFPSNFIFWWESERGWYFINKIPAIFCDIGIAYLLYRFVSKVKNIKAGLVSAFAFSFTPAFWYNSAVWGQTDSIYAILLLAAFCMLHDKKLTWALVLFTLSVLTKPVGFFVLPIFVYFWAREVKRTDGIKAIFLSFTLATVLYFPFHPENLIVWVVKFYQRSLGGELSYVVANAFNFWSLVFGFDNRPDTTGFLGLPMYVAGNLIYIVLVVFLLGYLWKHPIRNNLQLFLLASITSFAAFIFLPRMHERYFYPTLLLLLPLVGINKYMGRFFILLSTIHLINLYHFWWVPHVEILVEIFSSKTVIDLIIFANLFSFVALSLYQFRNEKTITK